MVLFVAALAAVFVVGLLGIAQSVADRVTCVPTATGCPTGATP